MSTSTNSSDTDDDLGLIPTSDLSDESDEAKSEVVDSTREYEFVTTTDLICEMRNAVTVVSSILNVCEGFAKSLLIEFQWNVDDIVNEYYDFAKLNTTFQLLSLADTTSFGDSTTVAELITECQICLTPLAETTVTLFDCGHRFCENCCRRYFEAKVLNDGEGSNIKCPQTGCDMLVNDSTLIRLIPDNALHILLTLMTHSYVESNPLLRYCPSEGCKYTMKANKLELAVVVCECGFESCLQCGEIWHNPISCELLKKWIRICIDDLENAEWLYDNTKKCPKCTFNIEKIGGCNHMQCRSCGYHFCWICREDWTLHQTCNKFEDNDEDITAKLIHYSTRYMNHKESLRLERGILDYVVYQMPFLTLEEVTDGTSSDMVFLKRAVKSLRQCRQILIATYVFAYFAEHCNQLAIFEDNQADLERATENLSWLLEQNVNKIRWVDVKHKLEKNSEYCDKRRKVLLDHIKEGHESNYWKLNVD